jgi:hypothetical protein
MGYKDVEQNREYNRQYRLKNREKILARKRVVQKEYNKTQMGRASRQIAQYKRMDTRNGFDNTIDFNAKWIVENIYTKPCAHCGETDWHNLGCNRLDNSKPHTMDNVEPCCFKCNCKLNGMESGDRLAQWAKENLSGKQLTEEHKKNISESMKAMKGGR